jgi:signal transduction histidine kinase/ligand-binding sensor domain-containing protein
MKKLSLRLLLFVGLILTLHSAVGQDVQYIFRQISTDRGLPGTNIKYIYQDKIGIMWLSVEAIGLCRFNGRDFDLYSHIPNNKESLSSNFINSIIEDVDSNLWIATEGGINKYIRKENRFKKYLADSANQSGLTTNLILCFYIDSKNNLWVGTGNGLYIYNKKADKFRMIRLIVDESPLLVNTIFEHSSGDFFIGTSDGLLKYNPITGYQYHYKPATKTLNGPMDRMISCILEDTKGNLWIGTYRGINKFIYASGEFEKYNFKPQDAGKYELEGFYTCFSNDHKYLWFASFTDGIVIIDSETGKYQKVKEEENTNGSLKSNHIRSIFQDRSGLLWIAAKFEGLLLYDSGKDMFNKLPEKYHIFQAIRNKDIRSVYNDSSKGLFWVGTMSDGLYRIDLNKNTIKKFYHDINNVNSIGSNRIHRIYRDSFGNLWVGQWTGLDFLDEKSERFIHYKNGVVDCIIEDVKHNIWVGTGEGIFIANKSTLKLERFKGNNEPFFSSEAIPIMFVHEDKKGQLWFATRNNGFYRYNPSANNLKHYSLINTKRKLRTDAIRAISEDSVGNLWIGTKGEGLCIFNPEKETFDYLTSSDGLASDFVLCIQRDLNGNFWIGGHNGLSQCDVKLKKFIKYSTTQGLRGNIFETGTNTIFSDGYLVFAGNAGLNIFKPKLINFQNRIIKDSIIITSVKAFGKEILRDVFRNSTIKLSYKQNYFTVEFVLSDFVDPLKHTFKYRIREMNENWYDLGNKNFVAISNIEPGIYHFEVSGTNEFGISCQNPLILTIDIKPPYYRTTWFKAFSIVTIVLLIFFYLRYRTLHNRKTMQNLEREILYRTEELREVNSELLAQNHMIESQKQEIERNQNLLEVKVKERTKDLEIAKKRAEESDKLKSAFLANMSHEIRTPLNAILGFSSIIVDSTESNPEFAAYSTYINNSSEMLLQIINDILDISKIEAGQFEVINTSVNLNFLLDTIYSTFNNQIIEKHSGRVKLIVNKPNDKENDLFIETDFIRLKQIIFNLMNNAIKFTKKGYIEFGYVKEQDRIKFFIKDTGIGIKQSDFSIIFNRFVKLELKDAIYRGNGLGLSLCKSIVDLLGGTIWVDSVIDQGSTFYFTIPYKNSST